MLSVLALSLVNNVRPPNGLDQGHFVLSAKSLFAPRHPPAPRLHRLTSSSPDTLLTSPSPGTTQKSPSTGRSHNSFTRTVVSGTDHCGSCLLIRDIPTRNTNELSTSPRVFSRLHSPSDLATRTVRLRHRHTSDYTHRRLRHRRTSGCTHRRLRY